MSQWFYCQQCDRWIYMPVRTVNSCPDCGVAMQTNPAGKYNPATWVYVTRKDGDGDG